jgi:hypothetical protein
MSTTEPGHKLSENIRLTKLGYLHLESLFLNKRMLEAGKHLATDNVSF